MATRLNKEMIEQIIANVIKDTTIPAEEQALKSELYERATALARGMVPPALLALSKQHPREWFSWTHHIYVSGRDDNTNPLEALGEQPYRDIAHDPVPAVGMSHYDVPISAFDDIRERAMELAERKAATEAELRSYLHSRRTVEAAVKDMPELEPHMTVKPIKAGALVAASNVLSVLTASGFSVSAAQQKDA